MQIKNSRAWSPNLPSAYLYAVSGTLLAFFMRYEFHPLMQNQFPVIFFIFNTTIISYKLGWKPAAVSAVLGMTSAYYFFIPPFNSFALVNELDLLNLSIYAILFVTVIFLIEKLQRERFSAVLIARVCESRMLIMAKLSSRKKN